MVLPTVGVSSSLPGTPPRYGEAEPVAPEDAWSAARRRARRRTVYLVASLAAAAAIGLFLWTRPPPKAVVQEGTPLLVPGAEPGKTLGSAVVAYSPAYRVDFFGFERLHPFDIAKYDRIAAALVDEGLVRPEQFAVPGPVSHQQLATVHDPAYLATLTQPKALSAALESAIPPMSAPAIERRVLLPFRTAVGGTVAAARHAARGGLGINLGGGYHHARPTFGHGFCLYNDVAFAVHVLREEGFGGPILVLDTDAHQGDGNHAALADEPGVFTVSLHQPDLFPADKVPGDLDISIPSGTANPDFIKTLEGVFELVAEHIGTGGLVIHVAGADVLHDDPLAGMWLTPEGLVKRDLLVARFAQQQGAGLLHVLAGGYGPSAAKAQELSVGLLLKGAWEPGSER